MAAATKTKPVTLSAPACEAPAQMLQVITAEAEARPPAPAGQANGTAQGLARLTSLPRLAVALAEAQAKCEPAPHDRENKHHKYWYSSSEAVITAAKVALAGSGIALVPCEQSVNGWDREGANRFELERKFLLLHSSGESLPILVRWPICPGDGRPLDKATAIAATLSLAYFLRDLLMMARVDPSDELAGQPDPQPAPARQAVQPPAQPAKPKKTAADLIKALEAKDAALAKAGLGAPGALIELVKLEAKKKGIDDLAKITPPWGWVTDAVKKYEEAGKAAGASTKQQHATIAQNFAILEYDANDVTASLHEWGVKSASELSYAQADDLIAEQKRYIQAAKTQATA